MSEYKNLDCTLCKLYNIHSVNLIKISFAFFEKKNRIAFSVVEVAETSQSYQTEFVISYLGLAIRFHFSVWGARKGGNGYSAQFGTQIRMTRPEILDFREEPLRIFKRLLCPPRVMSFRAT